MDSKEMHLNDMRVDPIVPCARAARIMQKREVPFPVKSPFTHLLLWVTNFSMVFTFAQLSADQNWWFGLATDHS